MTNIEAIRILSKNRDMMGEYGGEYGEALDLAIKALKTHEGKWKIKKINWGYPECSECGHVFDFGGATDSFIDEANYCPNCGSYNGGEEGE